MLAENILNYGRVKSSLNSCLDKKKILLFLRIH